MPYKDPEAQKAYMRTYSKGYYAENRLDAIRKQQEHVRSFDDARRLRENLSARVRNFRIKVEVITAYGGRCTCCGEDDPRFLCIDHVNGGGNKLRKAGERTGTGLYLQLRKQGYPGGFQVLCHNCNQAKADYTECPHHLSVDPVTSLINQYRIAYFRGMRDKAIRTNKKRLTA